MKTAMNVENRFENDASRYAAYLETPEGRLRGDLTFANLQEFLPTSTGVNSLRALDVGGGTGAAAVRLARLGVHVTLLDSSLTMLEMAERMIARAGVAEKIVLKHADAAMLANTFQPESFDIIVCHNLLEYADDPRAILCCAMRLMRHSSAIISILVRSQVGEGLKAALQLGDLDAAERNLTSEWGQESLYGSKVRLFTSEALERALTDASLTLTAKRGVRVIADYLPAQISRSAEYERIFNFERRLSIRPEFVGVARYLQYFARRLSPSEGNE